MNNIFWFLFAVVVIIIASTLMYVYYLKKTSYQLGSAGLDKDDKKVGDMTVDEFFTMETSTIYEIIKQERREMDSDKRAGSIRLYWLVAVINILCFIIAGFIAFSNQKEVNVELFFSLIGYVFVIPSLAMFFYSLSVVLYAYKDSEHEEYKDDFRIKVIGWVESKLKCNVIDDKIANYIYVSLLGAGNVASIINSITFLGK